MDRVLQIFDSIGVKVIMDLHNVYDMQNDFGSWMWVNNWKELAQRYKGDKRIAAFQIANEPQHKAGGYDTWATDGPLGPITDRFKLQQVFAYLIREIHKIDPDRVVIYPTPFFQYSNYNEWFADLQTVGIVSESNVVYDVSHPYFFENQNDMGMTPEQRAEWYANNQIAPSVRFFGAEKCWVGETFAWKGSTYHHDLQVRWLTAIINQCVEYSVGFDILNVVQYLQGPTSPSKCWDEEAMLASNYKP
jgi:aryl-phospho-beta-D-glucosidase BglC (GH1 family)